MTYDPREYWTSAPPMQYRDEHARQELALLGVVEPMMPATVLEIGVGFGRIADLLTALWPAVEYTGIDISAARIAEARQLLPSHAQLFEADLLEFDTDQQYDLVIAVEVLMHVRPSDLSYAMERLRLWSRRHVVTVDWTEPVDGPVAPWNFLHDYAAHGLEVVATTGRQSIHVWGQAGG